MKLFAVNFISRNLLVKISYLELVLDCVRISSRISKPRLKSPSRLLDIKQSAPFPAAFAASKCLEIYLQTKQNKERKKRETRRADELSVLCALASLVFDFELWIFNYNCIQLTGTQSRRRRFCIRIVCFYSLLLLLFLCRLN